SEPAPTVQRVVAPSVPLSGHPEAEPEGEVAERLADVAPALRDLARQVVPPQEHPGVDHRVRSRDEARRASRRYREAAGRLRPAGDRARAEGPTGEDVHLVRLPRLTGQHLAERPLSDHR